MGWGTQPAGGGHTGPSWVFAVGGGWVEWDGRIMD